jgi:hypothetical protein
MEVNVYKCRLMHDNGIAYVNVIATSQDSAIRQVCAIEQCPQRAITIIEIKPITRNYEN